MAHPMVSFSELMCLHDKFPVEFPILIYYSIISFSELICLSEMILNSNNSSCFHFKNGRSKSHPLGLEGHDAIVRFWSTGRPKTLWKTEESKNKDILIILYDYMVILLSHTPNIDNPP